MNAPIFKTITGIKPVLISAPHVYAHRRPRLNMSYKLGEPFTDHIVEEVCKLSNIFGIMSVNETDFDPNYHKEKRNPYKQEIRKIVKEKNIKYFIDIHGLKDGNNYDLAIYYPTRFWKSRDLAIQLQENLDRGELRGINIAILRFLDNNQETLGEFVTSKLRIPSIQIEVARYIREDASMRNTLVNNLSDTLSKLVI